jgi:phosphatidylglycerol:prolipoprotein diacylglycerol transferase
LGFLAAVFVGRREFLKYGLPAETLDLVLMALMLSGLFGARLFYFLVNGIGFLFSDPLSFFRIWEGGLVFYGGFIGGFLFLVIFTRIKKMPLLSVLDPFTVPLLLGQAIGRLGCFSAGCCYGRPTTSWVGVTYSSPNTLAPLNVPLHPTQLYESAMNFLLLGGLLLLRRRFVERGLATAYYLIGYGTGRFLLEFVRGDDRGYVFFHLQPSQWVSLAMVLIGLVVYAKRHAHS